MGYPRAARFCYFCRSKSKTKKKHKERITCGLPRNKKRELTIQPMNNNRYSTAFLTIMAVNGYLSAGSTTSIYASKTNFKTPAAPLKSTIYPRLIFGNSVALSER